MELVQLPKLFLFGPVVVAGHFRQEYSEEHRRTATLATQPF